MKIICVKTPRYVSHYSHFGDLTAAKLKFNNIKPRDPDLLTYDARMMWTPSMHSATWKIAIGFFPSPGSLPFLTARSGPGACSRVACAACGWRAENNESCSPAGSEELTMPVILPGQTDIYALTDARLSCGRTLETVVSALLGAGVKIIQYREKHMKSGEMLEECRLMRRLTREAGACFIVDDHVDLAILAEADGVHIGQEDFPLPAVRQLVGPKMCIGLSTHSPEQARAAVAVGADYIGVGPIFATKTKEDVVAPVGFDYLDWVAANISIPFVAIGGIKEHNITDVARHGARCCALVSELVGAPDIAAKVQAVRAAMQRGM